MAEIIPSITSLSGMCTKEITGGSTASPAIARVHALVTASLPSWNRWLASRGGCALLLVVAGQEPGDVEIAAARLPAAHQTSHGVALLLLLELSAHLRVH